VQIKEGMKYEPSYNKMFLQSNISDVNIFYTEEIIRLLAELFPSRYKLPDYKNNLIELDKIIEQISHSNVLTKRKRNVISHCEIYNKTNNETQIILKYGEKIDPKKWNQVKAYLNRNSEILFSYDVSGILILSFLRTGDPLYLKRFLKFSGFVSAIVESREIGVPISPDFNPETDLYIVHDISKLLEVYNHTRASLVVIGEELNEEYTKALNLLKSYDPFVKTLIINYSELKEKADVLHKIKAVYKKEI
jgi:hypothetical protein